MFDDDFTDEEWKNLLDGFTKNLFIAMKDDSVAYICLDWRRNHELVPYVKAQFHLSNVIIWDKMVHGLGSDYKYTYEIINVCKKGKPELNTNQGEQDYQDIWHIQRKMGRDEDHATKKPNELIARAIKHASKKDDIILDIFGGSGSTLLTAEQLGRRCFVNELLPNYCSVIITRWLNYMIKEERNITLKCNGEIINYKEVLDAK
jgi:DNA modification methylase